MSRALVIAAACSGLVSCRGAGYATASRVDEAPTAYASTYVAAPAGEAAIESAGGIARALIGAPTALIAEVLTAPRRLGESLSEPAALRVVVPRVHVRGGIEADVIRRVLRRARASRAIQGCYESVETPPRAGVLELRWFDPGSGIPRLHTIRGPAGTRAVRPCIRRVAEAWRFPKPRCTAVVTLRFGVRVQ